MTEETSSLFVNSVEKAFRVLECFRNVRNSLTMGQIATQTGYTKSAVQRSVYTLIELGYLKRNADGELHSGLRCMDLAYQFMQPHPVIAAAFPILLNIRDRTGERTNLSLFDGATLVYAIRLQNTKDYVYATSLVGRRIPTWCTSGGRAMLACLPPDEAQRLVCSAPRRPLTPMTKTDVAEIMAEIDVARSRGYARVVSELVVGEVAIGAAIVNTYGTPMAAIHLSSNLAFWKPDEFEERYAPLIVEAAHTLSEARY